MFESFDNVSVSGMTLNGAFECGIKVGAGMLYQLIKRNMPDSITIAVDSLYMKILTDGKRLADLESGASEDVLTRYRRMVEIMEQGK